jgi:hypothetical protein
MEEQGLSFHNWTHSILIVGWGVDEKTNQKYWILRNSYGPNWGENGDFKVARGTNDFGIEAHHVSYIPVACAENSTDSCILL